VKRIELNSKQEIKRRINSSNKGIRLENSAYGTIYAIENRSKSWTTTETSRPVVAQEIVIM
jgi:hypothetical protein